MVGSRRLHHRPERAYEVADIVRRGEPAAIGEREAGVLLHHRQDRRESEAADSLRERKREQPGKGCDPRDG